MLCAQKFLLLKLGAFGVAVSGDSMIRQHVSLWNKELRLCAPLGALGVLKSWWKCCSVEQADSPHFHVRVSKLILSRLFCHLFLCSACPKLLGFF